MGTGDWGLGDKVDKVDFTLMPNAQFPMPNAQCPMPHAQFPMKPLFLHHYMGC
ncbi:histidine kinase [Nostoc sp. CMAA1605]|uniref:histidine kinase n=1 Tax=Nostoc sp. CMAA1605 TaxID=2055159 RepID=UPI001F28112C|nr:histidine kinase [Nostoc sp. CMAA1605]